jgi:hypothetical protein
VEQVGLRLAFPFPGHALGGHEVEVLLHDVSPQVGFRYGFAGVVGSLDVAGEPVHGLGDVVLLPGP